MKVNTMNFPHPVLTEYTKDFVDSSFEISLKGQDDINECFELNISYSLQSPGLNGLIESKIAEVLLRVICYKTSYRTVFVLGENITRISIPKKFVADTIKLQGIIVINKAIEDYRLEEFNRSYFGNFEFSLRKGDVLANEPGIIIKLDTFLEDTPSGVVFVAGGGENAEMKVNYAKTDEKDPQLTDYIVITLPKAEFEKYSKLRNKKHLKNGIERFLQASLILPAVTEGLSRLRKEFEYDEDYESTGTYRDTVWAESFLAGLRKLGIESLQDCSYSDFELANKLLGNVEKNSLDNLMEKLTEWSTIRDTEDDI
ncbi:MAG: hypothetical protein ACOX2I_01050 [Candidatus Ozemobacteraceae bacterium]